MHQLTTETRQEETDDWDDLIQQILMQKDSPLVTAALLVLGLLMVAQQILVWTGPHRIQEWVQQL